MEGYPQNTYKNNGYIFLYGKLNKFKYKKQNIHQYITQLVNLDTNLSQHQISVSLYFYPIQKSNNLSQILQIKDENFEQIIQINQQVESLNILYKKCIIFKEQLFPIKINCWNYLALNFDFKENKVEIFCNNVTLQNQLNCEQKQYKQMILNIGDIDNDKSFIGLLKDIEINMNRLTDIVEIQKNINKQQKKEEKIFMQINMSEPIQSISQLISLKLEDSVNVSRTNYLGYGLSSKECKLIICHDMMGGYKEDHINTNIDQSKAYRFNHWALTDIFIYFSHHFITIPVKSYIDAAHKSNTLILGTIITEGSQGTILNSKLLQGHQDNKYYFADKLIQIADYYNFDGYLINIESQVNQQEVTLLLDWLNYITIQIKQYKKHRIIVWYDSVIFNGQLQWQSMLNQNNQLFIHYVDYFFTDYKWDLNKLTQSVNHANQLQSLQKLFTGIDVFGRGSYQGAKFNTYIPIQECVQRKSSVALFAPGWTYEGHSQIDYFNNELQFWHGIQSKIYYHNSQENQTNQWQNEIEKGNGFEKYYDQESKSHITVFSFDYGQRQNTFYIEEDIKNNQDNFELFFQFQVQGTPPKTNDYYVIINKNQKNCFIELLNQYQQTLCYKQINNNKIVIGQINQQHISIHQCDEIRREKQITISARELDINLIKQIKYMRIIQTGKDIEHFSGFYGPRFSHEKAGINYYQKEKDIYNLLKNKKVNRLPYHSYFNIGIGKEFFYDGVNSKQIYNNMQDYDFFFSHLTKNNQQVQIRLSDEQVWNGGSSLKIFTNLNAQEQIMIKLLKTDLDQQLVSDQFMQCDLNIQGEITNVDIEIFLNKQEYQMQLLKIVQMNGWSILRFQIQNISTLNKINNFYMKITNLLHNTQKVLLYLGGISIQMQNHIKQMEVYDLVNPEKYIYDLKIQQSALMYQYNKFVYDIQFKIQDELLNDLKFVRVFSVNDKWISNYNTKIIQVENIEQIIKNQQQFQFKIQIVLKNGYHFQLKKINSIFIDQKQIQNITDLD